MPERKENWQDMSYAFWSAFDLKRVLLGLMGMLASVLWVCAILWLFSGVGLIKTGPTVLLAALLQPPLAGACGIYSHFCAAATSGNWKVYLSLSLIIFGLLAIWSVMGGAITRIASLDYAKGDKVGMKDSLGYCLKKFWSYFWAPVAPIVAATFFVLLNAIGGLVGQVKFLEVLVALGFPLILLFSFLILFVAITGAVGSLLMIPTISADGSDAFDAMSRAYSYVLSKPINYVIYLVAAAGYGALCLIIAATVIDLLVQTSFITVGMGMGKKFDAMAGAVGGLSQPAGLVASYSFMTQVKMAFGPLSTKTMVFTASALLFYIVVVKLVLWSIAAAFLGSAQTVLYLLMRRDVDGTEVADVYVEEVEEEIKPPEPVAETAP